MAKFLLVANWKANQVKSSELRVKNLDKLEIVIAPAYPFISFVPDEFTRAAQDISGFPIGAYTGEVPGKLLAELGVKYCLVGHSERRKYLHETNFEIEAKIKQAGENNITPIICAQTIEEIPTNIRNYPSDKFMIMYEPFSAISTDGQYHSEKPEAIESVLQDWKSKLNLNCRFLYGGSVNEENCKLLILNCKLVSGFVVGHASLDGNLFSDIIKKCLQSLS